MRWLAEQLGGAAVAPRDVLSSLAQALAAARGASLELIDPHVRAGDDIAPVPLSLPSDAGLDVLARAHEWIEGAQDRHDRGMHYTPMALAERLIDVGTRGWSGPASVCDPTVGGGTFLLAAATLLAERGGDRADIAANLHGADIDPLAVAVARTTLSLWAGTPIPGGNIVVADSLNDDPWPEQRFDWIVGNPPFLNQLGRGTARRAEQTAALRRRFGPAVSAYTDTAALFLRSALDWVGEGGRIVLVQPLSLLAARDAGAVREAVVESGALRALWVATDAFEAAVNVCGVVVERGGTARPVQRYGGVDVVPVSDGPPLLPGMPWAPLAAPMVGMPEVVETPSSARETFGSSVAATAGFRDEYYAVSEVVAESTGAPDELRVVSVGGIDPLKPYWGERPTKIGGTSWRSPVVTADAVAAVNPSVGAWIQRLSVPKLLVATQSATLEVIVDASGTMVPLTPVVALVVDPERLWHVAAALSSPWITAVAASRSIGSARSVRALKLAAREFAGLPLPNDQHAWDRGARMAKRASQASTFAEWDEAMAQLRATMNAAYGTTDTNLLAWFGGRSEGTDRRVATAFSAGAGPSA